MEHKKVTQKKKVEWDGFVGEHMISSSPIQMNGTVAEISGACEYTLTPDGNIAVPDTATGPTVSKSSPKKSQHWRP